MKLTKAIFFTLLATVSCQTDVQVEVTSPAKTVDTVDTYPDEDVIFLPESNHNGWVNPEDIAPMPQCIAQQSQSIWLDTMNQCTRKICLSRFLFFCTHSEWLTQLNCLSARFSRDVVEEYLPYCSRSVLAKAQLYYWIRQMTGRTWLVEVGDANGLATLSPASLKRGYTPISTTSKAPSCLENAPSVPLMEPFQHVVASCTFTSKTKRTGDEKYPWKHTSSIIPLGFEAVGYDLTGHSIRNGEYFDKECFCGAFTMDPTQEPCSEPEPWQVDKTSERLWLHAICGPKLLPDKWTEGLKIMGHGYTPLKDWRWPACVTDMPEQVTSLVDECETNACELDAMGYCKAQAAINKECFCRDISYDSCGGLCHIFETRIEYVKWLRGYCGSLEGWHGLPEDWQQLTVPTLVESMPWKWTLKSTPQCMSSKWNLRSLIFVNTFTLIVFLRQGTKSVRTATDPQQSESGWVTQGILLALLQFGAHLVNATLVQTVSGYEDVPIGQLVLLWLTMPRLGWLRNLRAVARPRNETKSSADASSLLAEILLQTASVYYMGLTAFYGLRHNFFFSGRLTGADYALSANLMYFGALLWMITALASISRLIRMTLTIHQLLVAELKLRAGRIYDTNEVEDLVDQLSLLKEMLSTNRRERVFTTTYGTLSSRGQYDECVREESAKLCARTAMISLPSLWMAQWLFWVGFLGLASENFCLPNLAVLTAIWAICSLVVATI